MGWMRCISWTVGRRVWSVLVALICSLTSCSDSLASRLGVCTAGAKDLDREEGWSAQQTLPSYRQLGQVS